MLTEHDVCIEHHYFEIELSCLLSVSVSPSPSPSLCFLSLPNCLIFELCTLCVYTRFRTHILYLCTRPPSDLDSNMLCTAPLARTGFLLLLARCVVVMPLRGCCYFGHYPSLRHDRLPAWSSFVKNKAPQGLFGAARGGLQEMSLLIHQLESVVPIAIKGSGTE